MSTEQSYIPETFSSIIDWQNKTFGPMTVDRGFERATEEYIELIQEIGKPIEERDYRKMAMEAADVIIVLAGFMAACGQWNAVDQKMAINRQRNWKTNGDGTGYHYRHEDKL